MTTVRIGSIQQVLKDRTLGKKKEENQETIHKISDTDASVDYKSSDVETLKRILKDHAELLMRAQRRGLASYLMDPVVKLNGEELEFTVGSKTLLTELEAEQVVLRQLFNKKAMNPEMRIILNAQKVQEYKVFTPKQRFEALAKKNPVLKDFENRFGLDFDA